MRKLTLTHVLVLFLISVAMTVFAWPTSDQVRKVPGSIHGWNATISNWQPLAVTGDGELSVDAAVTVTIGTATVSAGAPPTTNRTDILSATSVSQSVTSLANRDTISVINHSGTVTLWVSMDSAVASAAVGVGVPVFPYGAFGDRLDAAKIVSVVADGTASATIYQTGY